eukprot:1144935-Pelagomonas_calceolata.AAC.8
MPTLANSYKIVDPVSVGSMLRRYIIVPTGSREEMKLRALFMKVSNLELGSLCDGIDEGEEPDLDMSREDGIE